MLTPEERKRRLRRNRREKWVVRIIGTLIILGFIALALWMRAAAPCWIFPLKEAPTRCLTIGSDGR